MKFFLISTDGLGNTLLNYSVIKGNIPIFEILLKNNANLSLENKEGFNPLELSIIHNQPKILSQLIVKNKEINEDFGHQR